MMLEISLSQDAVGKTIHGSAFSPSTTCRQVVIVFTDGTFATLESPGDPYEESLDLREGTLDLFGFGDTILISLGIITADELEVRRQARDAESRRQREHYERTLLTTLQEKYQR